MKVTLSLHMRLALMAVAMVCAALVVTTYALVRAVTWAVSDNLDITLDDQIRTLDRAIGADGAFDRGPIAYLPGLSQPRPGWSWQVATPRGVWGKGFPRDATMEFRMPRIHPDGGIYSGQGTARNGAQLHIRRFDTQRPGGPVTIMVIAPSTLIDHPLARVTMAIRQAQVAVALVLLVATVLQLHFGLRPLRRLGRAVARVRIGEAHRLVAEQPAELAPLASEINGLIERNEAALRAARLHAANLAHAVKTPLSSLMLQLEFDGAGPESQRLVTRISQLVGHHLRRARSGAAGLGLRARADAQVVADMVIAMLAAQHRDRGLVIENRIPAPCPVAVEAEDLGEMLGNLLENACRHARHHIRLRAEAGEGQVALIVEDDGQGIPAEQREEVLRPGVRLDEMGEGYGLGLAIVQDLVGMYEGTLSLGTATDLGGLRSVLRLSR